MKPLELFMAGIKAGTYKRMDWIRAMFCLVMSAEEDDKTEPYPYKVIQRRDGVFYIDPDNDLKLSKVVITDISKPLVHVSDVVALPKGSLANVNRDIKATTVGNVVLNAVMLIHPFGDVIPFQEGEMSAGKLEKMVAKLLQDNPKKGEERKPGVIYIDQYLEFTKSAFFVRSLTDIMVPGSTKVTMTPPDGIVEFRQQLFEEYKGRLNDPVVLAEIDRRMFEYDDKHLATDPEGLGMLNTKKLKREVRRKLFLSYGGVSAFNEGGEVDHVPGSLSEGIRAEDIPVLNSDSRSGSFNRGHETMLGGAKFKELIRAASNVRILDGDEKDCGTKLGKRMTITEANADFMSGFYLITDKGLLLLDDDNVKSYIGKDVMVRSTMYCKASKTDYCAVCAGTKLALHPTATAVAVSDIGSTFLILFLKKMHVTGLSTAKMNFKEVIS